MKDDLYVDYCYTYLTGKDNITGAMSLHEPMLTKV